MSGGRMTESLLKELRGRATKQAKSSNKWMDIDSRQVLQLVAEVEECRLIQLKIEPLPKPEPIKATVWLKGQRVHDKSFDKSGEIIEVDQYDDSGLPVITVRWDDDSTSDFTPDEDTMLEGAVQ